MSEDKYTTIPLTRGQVAIVDEIDADLGAFKWQANFIPHYSDGGKYTAVRGVRDNGKPKQLRMNRVVMERVLNRPLLRSEFVDHENLNPLDNRRSNLRLANRSQNGTNSARHKNNTSGYKGVAYSKREHKWQASITHNGKMKWLGYFPTSELAYEAYCKAAKELHGEFARLK